MTKRRLKAITLLSALCITASALAYFGQGGWTWDDHAVSGFFDGN